MKRSKITVSATCGLTLLILLLGGIPLAYGAAGEETLQITPGRFESGTVEEGQVIAVTVTIANRGSGAVEITNVRTN